MFISKPGKLLTGQLLTNYIKLISLLGASNRVPWYGNTVKFYDRYRSRKNDCHVDAGTLTFSLFDNCSSPLLVTITPLKRDLRIFSLSIQSGDQGIFEGTITPVRVGLGGSVKSLIDRWCFPCRMRSQLSTSVVWRLHRCPGNWVHLWEDGLLV